MHLIILTIPNNSSLMPFTEGRKKNSFRGQSTRPLYHASDYFQMLNVQGVFPILLTIKLFGSLWGKGWARQPTELHGIPELLQKSRAL